MKDSNKHKGLRKKLVLELLNKGIRDEKVLNAINLIPRHFFLDKDFENFAYIDKPFPIGEDQTISQPYTVAFQTEKLKINTGDKILEIGSGSGYQTSILVSLKADVYSIERIYNLYKSSKKILSSINLMPKKIVWGDGYLGLLDVAPFDKILIAAACNEIPTKLLKQLKIGGKMILPIGNKKNQIMNLITRISENKIKKIELGNFLFVPMLKNKI
ncbi:MAG: protein-L-isoaspartate(D-aspartate) O-methyltransferase [Flavobacteriaceae bacterium]